MEDMHLVSKLMLALGILGAIYTIVYSLLIWSGYFSERPPQLPGRNEDSTDETKE